MTRMTQPSSTLNTGLSFQNEVSRRVRVAPNTLDFHCCPVQRPRRRSLCYCKAVFFCTVLTLGLTLLPFLLSFNTQLLPERTVVSCLPAFQPFSWCLCSRDQILQSDFSLHFPSAGELDVDDSSIPTRQLRRLRCCFCMASFCLNYCCRM